MMIMIFFPAQGIIREVRHSEGRCGTDCTAGRCAYNNCIYAPESKQETGCSGGGCHFVQCQAASCDGGRCTFTKSRHVTCKGGGCAFEDPDETLTNGYCTGGGCTVDGEKWPSRIEGGLTI
ncbi:unnamed protein product [Heterosigma akashiwo]